MPFDKLHTVMNAQCIRTYTEEQENNDMMAMMITLDGGLSIRWHLLCELLCMIKYSTTSAYALASSFKFI